MSIPGDSSQHLVDRVTKGIDLVRPEHRTSEPEYAEFTRFWLGQNQGAPNEYKGYYLYPGFEPDTAQYAYDKLEMRPGDILVAAYPKTGTHWLIAIAKHIVGRGDPELLQKRLEFTFFFTHLELGPVSKYKVTENFPFKRRIFGTHLPVSLINLQKYKEQGVKVVDIPKLKISTFYAAMFLLSAVIYLTRNPKDQAVSWYNFMMSYPQSKSDYWKPILPEDEKAFYDLQIAGKQFVFAKKDEGYLESVREWWEYRKDDNVLFMVFEKIKKDPRKAIRKLADFIGESPSEEELTHIVERTSINYMRKKAESGSEKSGVMKSIRKGQVGDWKKHLTVAQSELIDQKVGQILGDTDIKFIYEA